MKKLNITFFLLLIILSSCSDWLDVNTDPNTPTSVTTDLIIPAAEASIAVRVGGNLFNNGGFFAQYWTQAPEANQYNAIDKNDIQNNFLNTDYQEFYSGALNDIEQARIMSSKENDWGNYLVATVLRAYAYQIMVDLFDKAPYTEALKGADVPNPKWDDGEIIYQGIVAEIDEALSKLKSSSFITKNDLILNGDIKQWIGFANALKLKIFMRSSFATTANNSAITTLINENNFFKGDVAFGPWIAQEGKRNPWYQTNSVGLGTVNNVATYNIITYLKSKSDPRISILYKRAKNSNDYKGQVPGYKNKTNAKTNDYSEPIVGELQPVYLFTQSELQLFIAEARLRFSNDDAAAKSAYESAIDANLQLHELEIDGTELYGAGEAYAWDSNLTIEQKLEQIMLQKWVCLCMVNHLEAWTEIRRTHYPTISTASGIAIDTNPALYTPGELIIPVSNLLGSELPKRMPYPELATIRNKNTPAQPGLTAKIWWDKK